MARLDVGGGEVGGKRKGEEQAGGKG